MTRARTSVEAPTAERARLAAAYVVTLAIVGVVGAVLSFLDKGSQLTDNPGAAALLLALMALGHALRIRFRYGQHTEDLNFFEATLAVAFVALTPGDTAVLAAVATAGVLLAQGVPVMKSTFNAAQWMVSAVAGGAVYAAAAGTSPSSKVVAVLAALVAIEIVNQTALAAILYLVTGHPSGTAEPKTRQILEGRVISAVTSISLGLLLAASYNSTHWTVVCAFAPLFLLHWASKGYATVQADHARLDGLQQVTHLMSVAVEPRAAYPDVIAQTRRSFEVATAELWLLEDGVLRLVERDDATNAPYDENATRVFVEELVRRNDSGPIRLTAQSGGACAEHLAAAGRRSCLAIPLRRQGNTLGFVCLFDRIGVEGFQDGEVSVASALAAELTGFLERTYLVDRLIEERAKLGQIVGQASDGILTLAADGTIRTWNAALENITGYQAEEMVGTSHLGLLRTCDESGADVWLERWARTDHLPERLQIRNAAGDVRWLSCSFTRASDGQDEVGTEATLIVVARDVTAAHELDRLKDDFVAVVSHELRTPLVPIKGWASMLLTRGERMTVEQRRDALESIQAQAQRLERLILNILDASRIEGGLEPAGKVVDVSTVASRVFEEMLPTGATHIIRLHGADRPLLALGQPVWVERALANLLANAVKYAPADTKVDVSLTREGDDIVLSVADEGPGIPLSWRERIFERFERIPDSETQTGTGLGLYITRQLVMAMGGRVELDTAVGRGTTFRIRLRAAGVGGHVPAPRETAAPAADAPREIALPNGAGL